MIGDPKRAGFSGRDEKPRDGVAGERSEIDFRGNGMACAGEVRVKLRWPCEVGDLQALVEELREVLVGCRAGAFGSRDR